MASSAPAYSPSEVHPEHPRDKAAPGVRKLDVPYSNLNPAVPREGRWGQQ